MHFSWSCLVAKVMSTVPPPWWNPRWLSRRRFCSRWFSFRNTWARISPAIDRKEIPRWLLHSWRFPLRLQMCRPTMEAFLKSWESILDFHIDRKESVIWATGTGPPDEVWLSKLRAMQNLWPTWFVDLCWYGIWTWGFSWGEHIDGVLNFIECR